MVYPGTCFLEATNVSEGRGTDDPFHVIGSSVSCAEPALASALSEEAIGGLTIKDAVVHPPSSKFEGQLCHGVVLASSSDPEMSAPCQCSDLPSLHVFMHALPGFFHREPAKSSPAASATLRRYDLIVRRDARSSIADRWRKPRQPVQVGRKGLLALPGESKYFTSCTGVSLPISLTFPA